MVECLNYLWPRSCGISASPVANLPLVGGGLRASVLSRRQIRLVRPHWYSCAFVLAPRSDEATPSMPLASPGIFVDKLGVDANPEGEWDFSNILQSGIIDIHSCPLVSLIQERCEEFSIKLPSNARGRISIGTTRLEQSRRAAPVPCCTDTLCLDEQKSAAILQSLQRQVAAHAAELASGRGDMTWLEEYVAVAQRSLVHGQWTLLMVEGERRDYHRHIVEEQRHGGLKEVFLSS